ncbi:MAG TPA: dTDP-4-dehydrorhamnose reductase [Bacteroidota bacterium]|nr:dTDP-4-dehydrorhamnose reductase [Bacteroidota bacterium]
MTKVLITGSNGLLGQKLVELLSHSAYYQTILTSRQGSSVYRDESLEYRTLNIADKAGVRKLIDETEPEIIVNTAAMTNVDQCETEREEAWRTNVVGVENLVHAAKLVGARIIQISTDYVFDGKDGPYDEFSRPNPICYYGRTKLAAENVLKTSGIPHAIVRTMVLYGMGHGVKTNFALWLLKSLSEGKPVKVVEDQLGNPTLADDLAFALVKIVELGRTGTYHIAGPDIVSRYEFGKRLAAVFQLDGKLLTPVKSAVLTQPAPRPLKSGFIILKAETELGLRLSGIKDGLTILKNQLSLSTKEHYTR